jgi:hypothetical protein
MTVNLSAFASNPPPIHHQKTTFCPRFCQNPQQRRENALKEKIALLV